MRAALVGLLLAWASLASAQSPGAGEPAKIAVFAPVRVTVWNRELVTLRAGLRDLTPADRAERVRRRIEQLPPSALESPVEIGTADVAGTRGRILAVGGLLVVGLVPQDLDPEVGTTLDELAASTAVRLREVLRARAEQRRLPTLLRGVGLSVGATALLAVVLRGLFRLHRRVLRKQARTRKARMLAGLDVSSVLQPVRRFGVKLTLVAALAAAVYVWLVFVLVQFPYTSPLGAGLASYLSGVVGDSARAAARALPGVFAVLVIFLITRFVARTVSRMFGAVEAGRVRAAWLDAETAHATRRIATALIWLFAIAIAYPYVPGSDTGAFKGISVFAGLLLTLGSSGLVNQAMSGMFLVYSRALRPGDYVRVDQGPDGAEPLEGVVTHLGLLSTKLTNVRHEEITVPNAVLVASSIRNFSRSGERQGEGSVAATALTIGYDVPWRQVHALLLLAADRTPGLSRTPAPRVLQRALSDFSVEYELLVSVERTRDRPIVLSELHARIQDVFAEHGVQIMSPHYEDQPDHKVMPPPEWRPPSAESDERAAGPGRESAPPGGGAPAAAEQR